VDTNSTKDASNVECAESSWTQQTVLNMKLNCTVRIATDANMDQKAMVSAVALDACRWTKEINSKPAKANKLQKSQTKNLILLSF
jgi:hypothetical protein